MKERLHMCFITLFCAVGLFAFFWNAYEDQVTRPAQEAHARWKADLCEKANANGEHDAHAQWACTVERPQQSPVTYWLLPAILMLGYGMVVLSPGNRRRR